MEGKESYIIYLLKNFKTFDNLSKNGMLFVKEGNIISESYIELRTIHVLFLVCHCNSSHLYFKCIDFNILLYVSWIDQSHLRRIAFLVPLYQ